MPPLAIQTIKGAEQTVPSELIWHLLAMLLQDHVFTLETSTPNAGRKISASFTRNGVVYENAGAVATPITGAYDAFTSRNVAVVLEAGVQVLRLTFGGGNDQDLRSFSIAPVVGGATSAQSLAGGDAVLAFSGSQAQP